MNYQLKNTILYLENVELGYGEKSEYNCVLKDINLIEKDVVVENKKSTGQIIAILGRSGRGKSTLFKALTGLVKPITGKILLTTMNEMDVDDAKEISEGDVGFVDQKYTLFRHKTVEQIFNYALRNSKKPKAEKKELIEKYLEDWNLSKHRNQYPCELSGGQRQRTAIIEQLLSSGHFMVLDEPTSGLDIINIDNLKNSFKLIQESHELNTIIFSTHDIDFALEMADSIYIIGFPTIDGIKQTYSTIVKHFDMKKLNLAWTEFGMEHLNLSKEIKEIFRIS